MNVKQIPAIKLNRDIIELSTIVRKYELYKQHKNSIDVIYLNK